MLKFYIYSLKYQECLSWISQLGDGFNDISQTGSFPQVGAKTKKTQNKQDSILCLRD